jgi:hypothetical protein
LLIKNLIQKAMENTTTPKLKNYKRRTLILTGFATLCLLIKNIDSAGAVIDWVAVVSQTLGSIMILLGLPVVISQAIIFFTKNKDSFYKYTYRGMWVLFLLFLVSLLGNS